MREGVGGCNDTSLSRDLTRPFAVIALSALYYHLRSSRFHTSEDEDGRS